MRIVTENGLRIAALDAETDVLRSEQDVLDRIAEITYVHRADHAVIPAAALDPAFFDLRSGLAGRILQKFVNHGVRVAVAGDVSAYQSKALRQFMLASNKGKHVYFGSGLKEALNAFGG